MCGIWAYIQLINNKNIPYSKLYNNFMNIKSRGPDTSIFQTINDSVFIGFHRLGIIDLNFHANQPFIIEYNQKTIVFICNGEIYNFKELIFDHNLPILNNSDCLTIPRLYIKYNNDLSKFYNLFDNDIKGEFAFILLEFDNLKNLTHIIAGRDQIGIRPLYYHKPDNNSDSLLFSSEIKGMNFFENEIQEFEPGTIIKINIDNLDKSCNLYKYNFKNIYNIVHTPFNLENHILEKIRYATINSIKRRLISDRPIAFLLSGGVDSSLVAAISARLLNNPINTYCCGMIGGTDLKYAKSVADFIKSNHHEIIFTENEGLNAIDDVIYTTETWDITTIRASVGQYLVCKYIGTKTDGKVVMVGEGPDEICSSYLFNYYAPNGSELHETAKEYVEKIHMFDGRRADRCISRWGLEGRIAFLDPEFISAYWEIDPEKRHPKYKGIEKWWLRKAFESSNILPHEVLWRKKEAFSDGVSSEQKSWFEIIQDNIKTLASDQELSESNYPTLESYYYKKQFIKYFGENRLNIIPHYWQPKWINNDKYTDPSARTLKVYNSTEN